MSIPAGRDPKAPKPPASPPRAPRASAAPPGPADSLPDDDVAAPAKNPDVVRCPLHGLSYNQARSTGCLRCPRPTREQARGAIGPEDGARGWSWSQLRRNPIKRVFAGLALALAIGFLPAAYYSFGISGAEVRRIRARQAELSAQPGTKPIADEFDHLEAAVSRVRQRGLIQTAIVWVLVTVIAGGGLYRVWGRGDRGEPSRD